MIEVKRLLIADAKTASARLRTCRECEHYKHAVCTKCGCFMPLKTGWAPAKCPVGKW